MYCSSPRFIIKRILSSYNIGCKDGLFDFGSGKGLVLAVAHKYGFGHLGGVEISNELAEISNRNFDRLGMKGIDIICDDARNATNLDNYNFFYFFNPFPQAVFSVVMDNIVNSYNKSNRKMVIIYDNPVCKEDVLKSGLFVLKKTIKRKWYNLLWCDICIFETKQE